MRLRIDGFGLLLDGGSDPKLRIVLSVTACPVPVRNSPSGGVSTALSEEGSLLDRKDWTDIGARSGISLESKDCMGGGASKGSSLENIDCTDASDCMDNSLLG